MWNYPSGSSSSSGSSVSCSTPGCNFSPERENEDVQIQQDEKEDEQEDKNMTTQHATANIAIFIRRRQNVTISTLSTRAKAWRLSVETKAIIFNEYLSLNLLNLNSDVTLL